MAETEKTAEAPPAKKGKTGLLIGVAAMALLGGGGFYATYTGLILGAPADPAGAEVAAETHEADHAAGAGDHAAADDHGDTAAASAGAPIIAPGSDVAFIPVAPLVVSLAGSQEVRHLRFAAQLEVPSVHSQAVAHLMPRVVDVMNGYLRAVDPADLEAPGALVALRAQMLRRVELVVGPGQVTDVLVMEFVLS